MTYGMSAYPPPLAWLPDNTHLSADTGSGCRSSSSVGGAYFSGRMRWRKETGSTASQPSHRSDTTYGRARGGMH
jgi:hypothetical protein